jgi:uncharacterized protein
MMRKRLCLRTEEMAQPRIMAICSINLAKVAEHIRLPAALLLCVCALTQPARAVDEDEGAGFFQYFPAVPDIKIPEVNIPFWTDDLKKGRRAYGRGDYARAIKFFRRESEEGSPVADWYLASMFRLGLGVKRDHAIAHSYYERVASAYDPDELSGRRLRIVIDSELRLADYMRVGIPSAGVVAQPTRAAKTYLRIASTYGHPGAHYALGVMSLKGEGMKQNESQGLKWLTAAAKKRLPEAQAYLGDLYWRGRIVKKSETRALMWYVLAHETARPEEHADITARYNELVLSVDHETRAEAEARARVWAEQYPAILNERTQ